MKLISKLYGTLCYLIGFAALLSLIAFIGDFVLPWTVNQASPVSPPLEGWLAVAWNIALVVFWGSQHSVMADPRFKAVWTRIVPNAVERSTYLIFVALMTAILIALWVPLPAVVWDVSGSWIAYAIMGGFVAGWVIVLISTFLIDHFHLFGLRQSWHIEAADKATQSGFVTPLFYRLVRHPMMTGVLIALWCAPTLTVGRLLFNLAMTVYIIVGTSHEEDSLVAELGDEYEDYRRTTPKLIPGIKQRQQQSGLRHSATD